MTQFKEFLMTKQITYPAYCQKIAAVDSHDHRSDWKEKQYWKNWIFYKKNNIALTILMSFRSWTYSCFLVRGNRG